MSDLETIQRNDLPSGWRVVELGNVISIIGGGTPKRNILDYWNGDIPWLTVKDFNNDLRHIDTVSESITKLGLEKSSTKILSNGQIIISARGTVGKLAQIIKPMAFNQSCYGINGKTNFLINDYLYYLLKFSIDGLKRISHGAVFDTITKNTFQHINSVIPPLSEQKAIANILGKLDDKIELNRQINQTLETMAQTLFKSWFVDFDPVIDNALKAGNPIPDSLKPQANKRKAIKSTLPQATQNLFPNRFVFNDILKKWIPEGWLVKNSENIAEISIGKTPPRKEKKWFEKKQNNLNQTWVSIKSMGNCGVFIADSNEYLTDESIHKFNVKLVPKDTVILSFKLTIGRVAITSKKLCTNEAIAHFSNPKFGISSIYLFCYLKIFNYDSLGSTSSIATAINSKIIKNMPILTPKKEVLDLFVIDTSDYFKKIKLTTSEIKALTKLRDILLPKLISGKIRIKTQKEGKV